MKRTFFLYELSFPRRLQEVRLQVLAQLLRTREENRAKMAEKRINRRWVKREEEKKEAFAKIRAEYAAGKLNYLFKTPPPFT